MKKILFALAAVVMLAPACTQDLTDGQNGTNVKMKKVTFGVTFEQPEFVSEDGTRISLNDENQIVWEEGDVVNVVYSYPYTTTNDKGETVEKTGFKISAAEIDGGFVGMPVDEEVMLDFELPAEENYTIHYAYSSKCFAYEYKVDVLRPHFSVVGGSTGTDANNCAAYTNLGDVLRDCFATGPVDVAEKTITLRNSAAFFEVKLTGNGNKVWSVDVLSKSQNLRSKYAYVHNPASENPTLAIYQSLEPTNEASSGMGGAHFYATGYTPEPLSSTPTSYYFAMPVGNLPAGDLFIQVRADDFTRIYRATTAHSFKRNHVTVLKPIEVKSIDTDAHTYEPLDAEGLSNCYMVAPSNEDKYYSFSVKNIDEYVEIWNQSTNSYGVWPMWATKEGLVEDISVIYGSTGATGRVYFKVPANSGNGSMMLTGGPLNATMIGSNWAWHIWITDAENQTVGSGDTALTFLDRGPGALWTPKSKAEVEAMTGETAAQTVGFMYQYGRHIPFPGPKSLQNLEGNDAWGYETCGASGNGTVGRFKSNTPAVETYRFSRWQNWFTVYNSASLTTAGTKYYNMQFLQNDGSWSKDLKQDEIKSCTGSDSLWLVGGKGKQDPCPQGYRVATFKELIKMFRYPGTAVADIQNNGTYCALNSYSTGFAGGTPQWRWTGSSKGSTFQDAFGGYVYHRDNATAKADLNDEFIWMPYGGMRLQYRKNPDHNNVASLYYAGMWDNNNDGKTIQTGYAFLWGVCDYYHTTLDTKTSIYLPSTTISGNFNTIVRVPCVFAYGSDNVWNATSYTSPMPASDAMPVRCVKMASASGEAQVSSLAAKQTDANAWN